VTFEDLQAELVAAVEEELLVVRESEATRGIPVTGGRALGQAGSEWLYSFGLHFPLTLPDDVPLRIDLPSGESYSGQLVASTAFEVIVSCGVPLPEHVREASLTVDTSFILEQLSQRLQEIGETEAELPMALFGFRPPTAGRPVEELDDPEANEFQLAALRAVLERDVTYVWGPPGTGKTTALALIGEALARRGLRVLAVAPTNVAVDNAALKLGERLGGSGSVVRFGTPQIAALREPAPGPTVHSRARGGLMQTMPLPFWEEEALPPPEGAMPAGVEVVSAKRLRDREDELARQRKLRQARVVATTLARVALTPELARPGFDAVLIDEASAAPLPAVFAAASLARAKVAALGDPRQLPPVAQSHGPLSVRWLQRDVFAQAGLKDEDDRAVLLREQYRMPPVISRLANELVYGGRLIDAPSVRRAPGVARLLDTSGEGQCERQSGSRLNRVQAELAVNLASEMAGRLAAQQGAIAIITPYRAQARLIWRLLRDRKLDKAVDVGTVHRFQGLEREAILFDTVEAPPERPAPFVSGGHASEAMRLLNVAITRSRSQLVVIANVDHLQRRLQPGSMLLALLRLLAGWAD
jgi:hypothetical protein